MSRSFGFCLILSNPKYEIDRRKNNRKHEKQTPQRPPRPTHQQKNEET